MPGRLHGVRRRYGDLKRPWRSERLRCAQRDKGMRTLDVIDAELRLLVVIRTAAREAGGQPSTAAVDELLDERLRSASRTSYPLKQSRSGRYRITVGRRTLKSSLAERHL